MIKQVRSYGRERVAALSALGRWGRVFHPYSAIAFSAIGIIFSMTSLYLNGGVPIAFFQLLASVAGPVIAAVVVMQGWQRTHADAAQRDDDKWRKDELTDAVSKLLEMGLQVDNFAIRIHAEGHSQQEIDADWQEMKSVTSELRLRLVMITLFGSEFTAKCAETMVDSCFDLADACHEWVDRKTRDSTEIEAKKAARLLQHTVFATTSAVELGVLPKKSTDPNSLELKVKEVLGLSETTTL